MKFWGVELSFEPLIAFVHLLLDLRGDHSFIGVLQDVELREPESLVGQQRNELRERHIPPYRSLQIRATEVSELHTTKVNGDLLFQKCSCRQQQTSRLPRQVQEAKTPVEFRCSSIFSVHHDSYYRQR